MLLSVVFSFRNEEQVLPELLRRVRSVMRREVKRGAIDGYELVFVNDASTDRSFELLMEKDKLYRDIRVVNLSRRFGVAASILAGLEFAQGDLVLYMDADLQDPPELIPKLIDIWQKDRSLEVIHTVRTLRKGESRVKLFITRIGYLILNKITDIHLPVEAGDFKLLTRRAADQVTQLKEKRPFVRGLVCWIGFKQTFVPYERHARYGGETKFKIFSFDVIRNFFESAVVSFSTVPLQIASAIGFVSILFSFVLLGHVLLEKFQGKAIPGWTAIMMAVIFIGSVQLFCTGIIGLYLGAVYDETKNRPKFIVNNTYGFSQPQKNIYAQSIHLTSPQNFTAGYSAEEN
ncbi:MAG: glycosyltransferase family 2 protein [Candidatus Omnitrophica bacterium]|nr:glycosyltransferase family 2 protein [Candidatus Omnitrophota bacterium]